MEIETVEDVCNELADKMGVYGACNATENGFEDCEKTCYTCCRVGFMLVMPDRIRQAVHNEDKLMQSGLLETKTIKP